MNKLTALMLLAVALPLPAAAGPVAWDFYATSCVMRGCDPQQQYPALLVTLTLAGPNSSGSAQWGGDPSSPPVYTGDDFSLKFSQNYQIITNHPPDTPAYFQGNQACAGGFEICDFTMSWSETSGDLDSVKIDVYGFHDDIESLGLGEFVVGSDNTFIGADGTFQGCSVGSCEFGGYWVDGPAGTVSEPGTLGLLMAGCFGFIGVRYRARMGGSRSCG